MEQLIRQYESDLVAHVLALEAFKLTLPCHELPCELERDLEASCAKLRDIVRVLH